MNDSAQPSTIPKSKKAKPWASELGTACVSLSRPDCEGWLTKLGGSGFVPKNWRRRWFVLKKYTLYYYKDTHDTQALGVIKLPGYIISPADPTKRLHNKFGFKVSKDGERTYYLCADDAREMYRWMNALSLAAIQYEKVRIYVMIELAELTFHQSVEEKAQEERFERERELFRHIGGFRSKAGLYI